MRSFMLVRPSPRLFFPRHVANLFKYLSSAAVFNDSPLIPYGWLAGLRVVVQALVISLFMRKNGGSTATFLLFSALGGMWSCLLDLPGISVAIVSPGRIPVC
jgi:hypothetical protein